MKTVLAFALSLFLTSAASAQSYIYQSGSVSPNHVPAWVTNGVLGDGGTAANGKLSSLGVTAQGPGICQNSAAITGPYNQLCLGVSTAGAATISLQNYGGAPAQTLDFVLNGVTYPFPGTGSGNVVGPVSSTVGDIAIWNNTTGTLLNDTGVLLNTTPPLDGQTFSYVTQNGDWEPVEPWPVPNKFALRSTYTQIAAMQTASPTQLNALVWGDSVAGFHATSLLAQLGNNIGFAGAFGCVGSPATGISGPCVTSNSTSGSVTPITGDFAHFPTGAGESLAVGACQVYGSNGGYALANNFYVFYIAEPGAGTITLNTNKNGAGFVQQATANAANASTIGAVISATMGDIGPYTFQVCASGAGAVKIWEGGFVNTNINGLVYESIAVGGIALSDMLYTPTAVTTPWYTVLNPNLVTFEMKNNTATETPPCATRIACLNSFVSTWTAINPLVDFVLLGSSPVETADSTQVSYNAALRSVAIANNAFYWDGYYPALNYATEVALGWINNGSSPHQTTLGQAAESNLLWSMSGLGALINSAISNNINNNTTTTINLNVGTPAVVGSFGSVPGTAIFTGGLNAAITINSNNFGVGTAGINFGIGSGGSSLASTSIVSAPSGIYFNAGSFTVSIGAQASATPHTQTLQFQNGLGTNIAGVNDSFICGGLSTGTGTDGDCIFQTGVKNGSSGTTAATPTTALTIKGETQAVVFGTQQTLRGTIVLANTAAGAYSTTIQSSNSASASWALTLPVTAGTNNNVLTTDGSGVTAWTAVSRLNLAQTFTAPQAITNTISSASGLTANWTVTTNTGGAGITGGPIAGGYFSTLNTTASSGSAADKIGVIGSCATTVNDTSGGGCYGGNTFAAVESGGAINRLVGAEDDIAIYSGSSASYRFGHTVINETSGVLQGSSADAAYVVGNIGATAGAFLNGVYFTNNYGFVPLASTAQVFNFDTMTVADVIHAPVLTCTNFINSSGVVLGCNGAMTLGSNGSSGGSVTMNGGTSGSSQFGVTGIGNPLITNVPNSAGNDPLCYGTGANTLSYATTCTSSDERIKKNIAPAPGLAATLCMAGVMFDWKDVEQAKREGRQIGLIAQDVQKCASELVSDNGDFSYHLANGEMVTIHDVLAVDYPRITAILINAVHDLNAQVVELKAAQKH